jgi:hypothetical protein
VKRPPKSSLAIAAFVLAIVAVCAVACTATALWVIRSHRPDQERDHHWVHEKLGLAEGEIPKLAEFEENYAAERNRLLGEMQVQKAELAKQLLRKSEIDNELRGAVSKIHDTHGKLQELSIQHYFDMLGVLDEPTQRRLRDLAAESLSEPPQAH